MKKIFILSSIMIISYFTNAQEFKSQLATAKTAYNSGKLDDSRFAMQQMLQQIDIVIGKEVLKLLPAKLEDKAANPASDNVSGSSGFMGVVIHRDYGTDANAMTLQIISNSPMISGINALLSLPLIGNSGDSKVVRVAGYKGLLQKEGSDDAKPEYTLQVPLGSSLLTLDSPPGVSPDLLVKAANSLPIEKIAKMLQ